MKNKKESKQLTLKLTEKRQIAEEGKHQLINLLLRGPEDRIEQKFTDKNLDRENEIIKLLGGGEITIRQIKEVIAKFKQDYEKTFPPVYYSQIDRLNNWHRPKERQHEKPPIVGRWTNEIIYSRFSKEILPALQQLNPYIGFGVRMYKHFQWLTSEGRERLIQFIGEAVTMMETCQTWYEFRVKYAKVYGVPFQLNIFEESHRF